MLALISLSLAIINLFPFLPLDGGHVFWAVAEKVRGKRIPFEVMERAGVVGFVLILMMFVIGLTQRHLDADRSGLQRPLTAAPRLAAAVAADSVGPKPARIRAGEERTWRAARSRRRWGARSTPRR